MLFVCSCYSNKAIADYERCYTSKTSWNVKVIPRNTDNNTVNGSSYVFSCFIGNMTELISLIETRT